MKLAKTDAAKAALQQILNEDAKNAAGGNVLVSKSEAKALDPANRRAEQALRKEGGKGTRVRAEQIATRAAQDAAPVWDQINVRGANILSKAEVKAIGEADPALASVTQQAYLRARGLEDPAKAVRGFFETFDFNRMDTLPRGRRLDVRPGQGGRADVPAQVLAGFDHYYPAERADWASVSLHEGRVAGQSIYALAMTTDGDDGYLEVYKKDGTPLTSARLADRQLFSHDEFFGRARLTPTILSLHNARWDEGMSEAPERAAAGQVPMNWPGDVSLEGAKVHHDGFMFHHLELPEGLDLNDDQQQVLYAAVELLWDSTFRHRFDGNQPLDIGDRGQGELRIGEFQRPDDGQNYLVADYRDIDDNSFVFYFQKAQDGLRLAIQQYDN